MARTVIANGKAPGHGEGRRDHPAVSGAGAVGPGTWLRRFQPAPPDAPVLVVLPHAGGSASHYRGLSEALSGRVEVLTVQYPGRQDRYRERPLTDLRELAERVAAAVTPWAGRRLALFGHSMGALVAFEAARLMERRGRPAEALLVSARRAPCLPREPLPDLDDAALLTELRTLGGTDERLLHEEELLRMYLPIVRADYQAVQGYACEWGATVEAPIVGLAGSSDPGVPSGDVAAWSRHTRSGFALRVFPGGHFYLDEQTSDVADAVASALVRRDAGGAFRLPAV